MSGDDQITQLLIAWSEGDSAALDQLAPLVYEELRRTAARQLRGERADHTLQPTALVHEAYLRLIEQKNANWKNRAHFFSLAAKFMRRILVDKARARNAVKRGEGSAPESLDQIDTTLEGGSESLAASVEDPAGGAALSLEMMSIDSALTRLESLDPRQAQIVELRFFGGLSVDETAQVMAVSAATVKRDWAMAKAWLTRELSRDFSP
jgi:RNA polymerase sigma factor (TIGR02999 family)